MFIIMKPVFLPTAWRSGKGSGGPGSKTSATVCQNLDQGRQPGDGAEGSEACLQKRLEDMTLKTATSSQ